MEIVAGVEYRDIDGFPGYRLCFDGTEVWVESCRGRWDYGTKWRRMKFSVGSNGYMCFSMMRDGVNETGILVHRIVCEMFHGACPVGMQCRHLDGDRKNCHPRNLSWGTPQENTDDKIKHGTYGRAPIGTGNGKAKLSPSDVVTIRSMRKQGMSLKAIAGKFSVGITAIRSVLTGRCWSHVT